jgi:hypothetical protein
VKIFSINTFKQRWHQRNLRARFEQVQLDPAIMKECREIVKKGYKNKIFFLEEDRNWCFKVGVGGHLMLSPYGNQNSFEQAKSVSIL